MNSKLPSGSVQIEGFPSYWVTPQGTIFSSKSKRELRGGLTGKGYLAVTIVSELGEKKSTRVHREVCRAFHGPSEGLCVNHINGIKTDNRPENLEWTTIRLNSIHSLKLGLSAAGENSHFCSKLNRQKVQEILGLKGKMFQREIASIYGVDKLMVGLIHRGRRWRYSSQNREVLPETETES